MTVESELRAIRRLLESINKNLGQYLDDQGPRALKPEVFEDPLPIFDELDLENSVSVKQTYEEGAEKRYHLETMPARIRSAVQVARQINAPFQVYQEQPDGPFRILTDGEVYVRVDRMTIHDEPEEVL
jgi:hypothetical protein